jgi:hypothetical protein
VWRSGGGLQGDLVAEGVQRVDVVADGALGAAASVIVVGSEVGEGGVLVAEQVPDDDQDGAADGDDRFLLPAAPGDPAVAFAEERGCAGDADGGFAQSSGQVPVAVAGGPVALRPAS